MELKEPRKQFNLLSEYMLEGSDGSEAIGAEILNPAKWGFNIQPVSPVLVAMANSKLKEGRTKRIKVVDLTKSGVKEAYASDACSA